MFTDNSFEVATFPDILTPEDLYGYPEIGAGGQKTEEKANPVQSVTEAKEVQKQITTGMGKSPFGSLAIILILVGVLYGLNELFK